jgi:exosome complex component CSL4
METNMMTKKIMNKNVFPGDKLAVIEEFNEGIGSFEEDGNLRSSEIGRTSYDLNKRVVDVKKITPDLVLPREGMIVIAEVGSVARRDARIDIFILNGKHIHPTYGGVIHISDISREYTKNIDMALRNGDIVKAKLVNTKNNLNQCSLVGPELGVIYAYCSKCGGLLEKDRGRLTCPDCGRVERRKTAKSYGQEDLT